MASRAYLVACQGTAQGESIHVVDVAGQELHALQLVGKEQSAALQERCYEHLSLAVREFQAVGILSALAPLDVAVGGAKVYGKYQFLAACHIGLPQWYDISRETARWVGDLGLDDVEGAFQVVVHGVVGALGAVLEAGLEAVDAHAVTVERERRAAALYHREQLHGIIVFIIGAHKGEYRCREHCLGDDATGAAFLVKLPRGVVDGVVVAGELDVALLQWDAQGHIDRAVGQLLHLEHVAAVHLLGDVAGVEILEELLGQGQQVPVVAPHGLVDDVATKVVVFVDGS